MIDLPVQLKRDEVLTISKVLGVMLQENKELLKAEDYLHYFNVKSLAKKFAKKYLNTEYVKKEKVKCAVNINEFHSVKFFIHTFYTGAIEKGAYWQILFQHFLWELEKQNTDLPALN